MSPKQRGTRSPFAACLQLPARSGSVPEGQRSSSLAGPGLPGLSPRCSSGRALGSRRARPYGPAPLPGTPQLKPGEKPQTWSTTSGKRMGAQPSGWKKDPSSQISHAKGCISQQILPGALRPWRAGAPPRPPWSSSIPPAASASGQVRGVSGPSRGWRSQAESHGKSSAPPAQLWFHRVPR